MRSGCTTHTVVNALRNTALLIFALVSLVGFSLRVSAQVPPDNSIVILHEGTTTEHEISGGALRTFSIRLDANRYVHIIVEQEGIDVLVTVFDPDKLKQTQVDRPNGIYGPESLSLVTNKTGVYELKVQSFERSAAPGRILISIESPRLPQPSDYRRIFAEQTAAEAERQRNVATANSLHEAVKGFERAIAVWKELGELYEIAVASYGLGWSHSVLCEYDDAISHFEEASRIMKDLKISHGQAFTLTGLAYAYLYLGENKKALENFTSALELRRSMNNVRGEAMALYGIGSVLSATGEEEKALNNFFESLTLRQRSGDRLGEAVTFSGIGKTYRRLGRHQEALYHLQQALEIMRKSSNKAGQADTLANIGWVYYSLGQTEQALIHFNEALPLTEKVGDPGGQAMTLYGLARVESQKGQLPLARDHIKAALDIVEALRSKISSEQLRASYFASVQDYYEFYIEVLMRLHELDDSKGYDAMALALSERARARNLLDLLSEAHANIRQGVDLTLVTRERELQKQINARMDYRLRLQSTAVPQDIQIGQLDREIDTLQQQYDEVQRQIRKTSPRYAALQHPEPLSPSLIQKQLMGSDTILLEYALGSSNCYLWIVTADAIKAEKLTYSSDEIRNAASKLIHMLTTTGGTMSDYETESHALSKMLLPASAVEHLRHKKIVLVVANGILQTFPFSMLTLESYYRPLVASHILINLPSASTLAALRSEVKERPARSVSSVAVFADPVFTDSDGRITRRQRRAAAKAEVTPATVKAIRTETEIAEILARGDQQTRAGLELVRLPGTRREARMIKRLLPSSTIALDFNANLKAVSNLESTKHRIIHFATHGIAPDDHPEFAGVVLSLVDRHGEPQEGYLGLPFVYNLNLPADLVVLSACETGLGEDVRGEGLIGLTRGFMYSGSSRVIASLWKVREGATEEIMKRFYLGLVKRGLSPAAALAEAEASMWAENKWTPADWAGFVFFGEWQY